MTTSKPLDGLRILIVEDEFLVAMELDSMIQNLGGEVLGPVSTVGGATELLNKTEVHGAVLDIGLGGENSISLAQQLLSTGVAILLTTGYSDQMLPETLAHAPRVSKPYSKASFQQLAILHFARPRTSASDGE
jgi:DNA-binding NarL/FixJ family response regulator